MAEIADLQARAHRSFVASSFARRRETLGARITSTNCCSSMACAVSRIQFAIESNDAAKGRSRIGAIGAFVGVGDRVAARHAAGIGMLDDHACRRVELPHALERRVAVGDIVVRQLLALDLMRARDRRANGARIGVEGSLLVRIFAVAQVKRLRKERFKSFGKVGAAPPMAPVKYADTMASYCAVCAKALAASLLAHRVVGRALIGRQFIEQCAVVARIDDHGHRGMILGRGTHHGRTADVDVVHRVIVGAIGPRHGGGEGIEIDGEQIDRLDAVLAHHRLIDAPPAQAARREFSGAAS